MSDRLISKGGLVV